jgi:hypothetical protein
MEKAFRETPDGPGQSWKAFQVNPMIGVTRLFRFRPLTGSGWMQTPYAFCRYLINPPA